MDAVFIGSLLVVTGMRVCACACVCVCVRSCVREMYWTIGGNAYSLLAIDLWGYRIQAPLTRTNFPFFLHHFGWSAKNLNSISEPFPSESPLKLRLNKLAFSWRSVQFLLSPLSDRQVTVVGSVPTSGGRFNF